MAVQFQLAISNISKFLKWNNHRQAGLIYSSYPYSSGSNFCVTAKHVFELVLPHLNQRLCIWNQDFISMEQNRGAEYYSRAMEHGSDMEHRHRILLVIFNNNTIYNYLVLMACL